MSPDDTLPFSAHWALVQILGTLGLALALWLLKVICERWIERLEEQAREAAREDAEVWQLPVRPELHVVRAAPGRRA